MNSLSARLLNAPLSHGTATGTRPARPHKNARTPRQTHTRPSASRPSRTSRARGPSHHGAHADPPGRQFPEFRGMGARVAALPEEANQRPPRMAPIPPAAWGTMRDTLRAFCVAPARAKAMYGIG
ncbi:cruzipain, partial [Trypanosoma cruzi]